MDMIKENQMRKKPEVPELNQAKLGFGQIETELLI